MASSLDSSLFSLLSDLKYLFSLSSTSLYIYLLYSIRASSSITSRLRLLSSFDNPLSSKLEINQ
jgi:hypothetical protein